MVGVCASINLPLHHSLEGLFWHQLTRVVPEKGPFESLQAGQNSLIDLRITGASLCKPEALPVAHWKRPKHWRELRWKTLTTENHPLDPILPWSINRLLSEMGLHTIYARSRTPVTNTTMSHPLHRSTRLSWATRFTHPISCTKNIVPLLITP